MKSNSMSIILAPDHLGGPTPKYGFLSGTSMAAPMVSGIAGLILSLKPHLTRQEVVDILEISAHELSTYTYSPEPGRLNGPRDLYTGYGLVDAEAALLLTQTKSCTTPADLYVSDQEDDFGIEPNTSSDVAYNSPDLWVRNQDDGTWNYDQENATYGKVDPLDPSQPVPSYVYVRVHNRGCSDSDPNAEITINWAKASTGLKWDDDWKPHSVGGVEYAGLVTPANTKINQIIPGGSSALLRFEWYPPNPEDFTVAFGEDRGHFCLLARILDGATLNEGPEVWQNTINKNNIAWKNVTVVPALKSGVSGVPFTSGTVKVRNVDNSIANTKFLFKVPATDAGSSIFDNGVISVNLGMTLYNRWVQGGSIGSGVSVVWDTRMQEIAPNVLVPVFLPILKINSPDAYIDNINLSGNETFNVAVEFAFKINTPTRVKNRYNYDLIQVKNGITPSLVGGERYVVNDVLSQSVYGVIFPKAYPAFSYRTFAVGSTGFSNSTFNTELFEIFPNPTKDSFTIKGLNPGDKIVIRDIQGKDVTYLTQLDLNRLHIELLTTGIYSATIMSQGGSVICTKPFIKL